MIKKEKSKLGAPRRLVVEEVIGFGAPTRLPFEEAVTLSAVEKKICRLTNTSESDFLAHKRKQKAR